VTRVFTGIVEALGDVVAIDRTRESARLSVRDPVLAGTALGDSVAVNGVCLTAASVAGDVMTADVMLETLQRTSLAHVAVGDKVNLERAATMSTRLGGHLVQGHVDGVATMRDRVHGDGWDVVTVELPDELSPYVVEKGSIALDGVSLTVAAVDGCHVRVSLIPETLRRTTWGTKRAGEPVNVEVDVLAKYVERLVDRALERRLAGRTESS
jgi:riboflavin synthase